jgi:putative transcriptional regulator
MPSTADDISGVMAAYSGGRLPVPLQLLIDTRRAYNGSAAESAFVADVIGGDALDNVRPIVVSSEMRARTLLAVSEWRAPERLEALNTARAAGRGLQELLDLPEPIRSLALSEAGRNGWRFAAPGVRRMELAREGRTSAELIRLEPGTGIPAHGHEGSEYTLVLTGAFHDGINAYEKGELCIAGPDTEHQPIARAGEVCIALAVTDAPLEFRGALGVLQKVFRLH